MTIDLKIALAQYMNGRDPAEVVDEAYRSGADIVVFPEMYSNGYASFDPDNPAARERWVEGAESADGPFVAKFRKAATNFRMHVVATFLESGHPKPFNAALLIGPAGQTLLHHRKVHICDFDTPENLCGRGDSFRVAEIEVRARTVKVGLMICMDREYSEAARSLSAAGAEIALVPNCCELSTDPTVGDVRIAQVRGRAFETVMGIAVANYPYPRCDGHSFAVDATGRLIAMADASPGIAIASFDVGSIRKTRVEDWFRWKV